MPGATKHPARGHEEGADTGALAVVETTTILRLHTTRARLQGLRNRRRRRAQVHVQERLAEDNSNRAGGLECGLAQLLELQQDILQEEVHVHSQIHLQPGGILVVGGLEALHQRGNHRRHPRPAQAIPARGTKALDLEELVVGSSQVQTRCNVLNWKLEWAAVHGNIAVAH